MFVLHSTATVTIYILPSVDRGIVFYPPPPNNQTVIVTIAEQQPIGYAIPYQVRAFSSNPAAIFNYQLQPPSDPDGYLTLDRVTMLSFLCVIITCLPSNVIIGLAFSRETSAVYDI
jgi:hypothetical protein